MKIKKLIILVILLVALTILDITKLELTVDIENPIGCYIQAFTGTKVSKCTAALLKKETEELEKILK